LSLRPSCGETDMNDMLQKPFQYTGCGLDYIYLLNGVDIEQTESGEIFYSIEDADQLHRVIALRIVTDKDPLRGQEVRFLRSMLEFSQEDLAHHFQVTRVTINRWEKAKDIIVDKPYDFMLRHLYISKCCGDAYAKKVNQTLEELDKKMQEERHLIFKDTPVGWQESIAA